MTPREIRSNCGNLHDQMLHARLLSSSGLFLDHGQTGIKYFLASDVLSKLTHPQGVGWLECRGFAVVPFPQCQPLHLRPIFWSSAPESRDCVRQSNWRLQAASSFW